MSRILVAGGTGSLGSAVVSKLQSTDHTVRILSQRPRPDALNPTLEWAQGDVLSGEGLPQALAGVDVIVNCLGNPRNAFETDVLGVKRLAEIAHTAHISHFFHISIVGIEQIDLAFYGYKIEAENAVIKSGVPYSIQRLTQFHTLLDFMMSTMQVEDSRYTLPIAGDAQFQLIDTRDAADYILPLLTQPAERLPDVGGMDIQTVNELARIYLNAQGITDFELVDPEKGFFPSPAVKGFIQGFNTVPDNRFGHITWADYVRERHTDMHI